MLGTRQAVPSQHRQTRGDIMNGSVHLFCILAMFFYAMEISVTDWKLSHISPRLLTLIYSLGVASCAAINLLGSAKEKLVVPKGNQWFFVALMILASFIAANAHFKALHEQSGAVRLTMYYCLLPVASSFLMFVFTQQGIPNVKTIVAWLLGAAALYLIRE